MSLQAANTVPPIRAVISGTVLRIRGLRKSYKSRGTLREAVRCTDIDLPGGQITLIYGPNGSGKTTFLRSLAGVARPSAGVVRLLADGDETPTPTVRYVPEGGRGFHAALSTRQNMVWAARLRGKDPTDVFLGASAALRLLLDENNPSRSLSRGQKQLLAIGMALIDSPDFLLLDEPSNGLDPPALAEVVSTLRKIAGEGCGVVIATHDLNLSSSADCVLFMDRGQILDRPPGGARVTHGCAVTMLGEGGQKSGAFSDAAEFIGSAAEVIDFLQTLDRDRVQSLRVMRRDVQDLYEGR